MCICLDIVPNDDFQSKPVVKTITFHNTQGRVFLNFTFIFKYLYS